MKAVAEEFAEPVPDAFSGDGVAFLQMVYKNPNLPFGVRIVLTDYAIRTY
jgi:hypothetical protein